MFQRGVCKFAEEQFIQGHVKDRNNLLRVIDQLSVQVRVEVFQVFAVEIQEGFSYHVDLKRKARTCWSKMESPDFLAQGPMINFHHFLLENEQRSDETLHTLQRG